MSRALLQVLALTLTVVAFGQAHLVQAYEGLDVMSQQPTGAEVLRAYVDPGAAGVHHRLGTWIHFSYWIHVALIHRQVEADDPAGKASK